jgi:hypothetical protein
MMHMKLEARRRGGNLTAGRNEAWQSVKGTKTREFNASSSTSTPRNCVVSMETDMDYIEIANKKSVEAFVKDYLPSG